ETPPAPHHCACRDGETSEGESAVSVSLEDLPRVTLLDAMTLFCGELIGSGISRQVYVFDLDPTRVIKFEFARTYYSNTLEAQMWSRVRDVKGIAAWFAPVYFISDHGRWMIQARTMPVTLDELRKEVPRVPMCFIALKAGHWGRLNGRIVCHDYGN